MYIVHSGLQDESLQVAEWSAHAPVNGGPVFPGTILGHFWFFVLFCFFVFCVFYFIKISKFALPGVMLIYERTSKYRKKEKKKESNHIEITVGFFYLHRGWLSLHRGHPVNVPIRRTMHLSSVIPANDTRESVFGHRNFSRRERESNLGPLAPEASA